MNKTDEMLLQLHLDFECDQDCPFCISSDYDEDEQNYDYEEGLLYDEY